jgi:hypothetical protein
MLWSGMPPDLDGGVMWSIVQSLPSSSLWQVTQRGSRIRLAYALASFHSLESCQSLIAVPATPFQLACGDVNAAF